MTTVCRGESATMIKIKKRLATTLLFITVHWVLHMSTAVAVESDSSTDNVSESYKCHTAVDLFLGLNSDSEFSQKTSEVISSASRRDTQLVAIKRIDAPNTHSATITEKFAGVFNTPGVAPAPPSHLTVDEPAQKKYTLTISINGGGTTEPSPGSHTYVEGTSVLVTATAANGNTFTSWSGAATGTENPVRLRVNADQTLTANFSSDNVLPDKCPRNCDDAVPVPATVSNGGGNGNVTMYSTEASSGGACNYGSTDIMYYAAIHSNIQPGDGMGAWQSGRACGQCAEVVVITSQGLKRVVVRIVDECPDANCGIDLGGLAPGELMVDGFGRYEGQWRYVSCDGHPGVSDGPPSLAVLDGSNKWWSRVQVRNGSMAVETISWQTTDGSKRGTFNYAQDLENGYEVPVDDVLQSDASSFLITVGYVDGTTETLTLSPADLATVDSYPLDNN